MSYISLFDRYATHELLHILGTEKFKYAKYVDKGIKMIRFAHISDELSWHLSVIFHHRRFNILH